MTNDTEAGLPERSFFRFFDKVLIGDGCWEWTGALDGHGYGHFWVKDKVWTGAHRFSYEQLVGPIPAGMDIDHLCRNTKCVRPDGHLEPVSRKENSRRGLKGMLKTHCAQGHPWIEENQYIRPGTEHRGCRVCRDASNAVTNARRSAKKEMG